MMKKLIVGSFAAALLIGAVGCGGSGAGCQKLIDKLKACGLTATDCSNDTAASCTAGKLDAQCTNLIQAATECS